MKKNTLIACVLLTATCLACSGKKAANSKLLEAMQEQQSMEALASNEPKKMPDNGFPKPAEGETLYVGDASFSDVGKFQVAFILSADKSELHDLTIYITDLHYSYTQGSSTTNGSVGSSQMNLSGNYSVTSAATDIHFGNSNITGLTFTGEGANAKVTYVYVNRSSNGDVDIPLGTADIHFKAM